MEQMICSRLRKEYNRAVCCYLVFLSYTLSTSWEMPGWMSYKGFPGGSDGKGSACNAGDLGSISGSGRSPGEGNGHPLQYLCLEKSHGQRSLVGCSPWSHKESGMTGQLTLHFRKLKQGLCINLRGWDEEGDGREFQKGEDICIPMADSCRGLTENNKIL